MSEEDVRLFRRRFMALHRRLRRELNQGPVPMSGALMLGAIDRAGGQATPGWLARDLQMSTSNVAATLGSLEADGLITRGSDASDARKTLVRLTEAGRSVVAESRRTREAWLHRAIEAGLTGDEQRVLFQAGELMERLADSRAGRDET
jgi:DNA-binding MarR family transcriptional regulator